MPNFETLDAYLQQVLKFKNQQAKHSNYLDVEQREEFLKELLLDMGFTAEINHLRKAKAQQNFRVYEFLKDDGSLNSYSPKTYQKYCLQYLMKAIALDPYNNEFLEGYLNKYNKFWTVEEKYKFRYLELFNPNSSKYQDLSIDLGLYNKTHKIDYLREEIVENLIKALIELEDEQDILEDIIQNNEAKRFEQNIKGAGVDAETMKSLENELPGHLETILKGFRDDKTWEGILKMYFAVEKTLAIAPYNDKVLLCAILFHASVYPRVLLRFHKYSNLSNNQAQGKTFFEAIFNKPKLNRAEKLEEAQKSFRKAIMLKDRYLAILKTENAKKETEEELSIMEKMMNRVQNMNQDMNRMSLFFRISGKFRNIFDLYSNHTLFDDKNYKQKFQEHLITINALFEQEFLTLQVAMNSLKSRKIDNDITKISLASGVIVGLVLSIFYIGLITLVFFMPFILLSIVRGIYDKIRKNKLLNLLSFGKENFSKILGNKN